MHAMIDLVPTLVQTTALADAEGLPPEAERELDSALAILEGVSLAVRLASLVGGTVERLRRGLPGPLLRGLDAAVETALSAALKAAIGSAPGRLPLAVPQTWFHRGALAACGAAGGAFGLPGTLLELPVSTTLLLRQIATVAVEHGEDPTRPEVAAECLKVFALGGRDPADDAAESGYYALRLALAEAMQGAVFRGAGVLLPNFVQAIATRFGSSVAVKVSAQLAPMVGAATGAAVNLAFLEHFRGLAVAHFTVRRLERTHGVARVRRAYQRLAMRR